MRIYLVRHGQSRSNVDWTENQRVADHAIELTEEGHRQARAAGDWLRKDFVTRGLLSLERLESWEEKTPDVYMAPTRLWLSPYTRTRQTADAITAACVADTPFTFGREQKLWNGWRAEKGSSLFIDRREHLMLAEQQFGLFDGLSDEEREKKYPAEHAYYEKCKKFEGKLWPQMPLGESRMQVCQRVHQAFGTFKRDAEKHGIENIVVVAHGTVNRAFIMMWLHLPHEWMHSEPNPANASIRLIEHGRDMGVVFPGFPDSTEPVTKETEE